MKKGFTLIELLVVVTVIGLVGLLLINALINQPAKARDVTKISNMANIKRALEDKAGDDACYPDSIPACGSTAWQPYLKEIPCVRNNDYTYYPDPVNTTCRSWYILFTTFEYPENKQSRDVGCGEGCSEPGTSTYQYDYFVSSSNAPPPAFHP